MLSRLSERLEFLTGGPRDAPSRQRTLRDTIRWGYELLNHGEQRVFRWLSVFSGGFDFEAAAAVLAAMCTNGIELLDVLASLLDNSMLVGVKGPRSEQRLGMLETIREFALDELERSGEAEPARQAHAEFFLALSRQAEERLRGPDQREWLDRLQRELPNLRLALRWLLVAGRAADALAGACSVERLWYARGHLSEGIRWLEEAIAASAAPSALVSRALSAAAWLAHEACEFDRGDGFALRALAVARELGDERATARALTVLGLVAASRGRYAEARAGYDEAIAIFRAHGDRRGLADALGYASLAALYEGDLRIVYPLGDEALAIYRGLGDVEGTAFVLTSLAGCAHMEGDQGRAAEIATDMLTATSATGHRRLTARALIVHGLVALQHGDLGAARAHLEEAAAILRELGDRRYLAAYTFPGLALVHIADGRPEVGARLFGCAEATHEAIGLTAPADLAARMATVVEVLRGQMGGERFATVWGEGRRLTPEDALDRALQTAPTARPAGAPADGLGELTRRETDVLRLLARGMTDASIADALVVSRRTVHAHLRSIYRKLDVASRTAATRWALEHGLS